MRVLRLPRVAELGDGLRLTARDEDRVEAEAFAACGARARSRRASTPAPRSLGPLRRERDELADVLRPRGRARRRARSSSFSTCRPSAQRAVSTPGRRRARRPRSPSRRRASSDRPGRRARPKRALMPRVLDVGRARPRPGSRRRRAARGPSPGSSALNSASLCAFAEQSVAFSAANARRSRSRGRRGAPRAPRRRRRVSSVHDAPVDLVGHLDVAHVLDEREHRVERLALLQLDDRAGSPRA